MLTAGSSGSRNDRRVQVVVDPIADTGRRTGALDTARSIPSPSSSAAASASKVSDSFFDVEQTRLPANSTALSVKVCYAESVICQQLTGFITLMWLSLITIYLEHHRKRESAIFYTMLLNEPSPVVFRWVTVDRYPQRVVAAAVVPYSMTRPECQSVPCNPHLTNQPHTIL